MFRKKINAFLRTRVIVVEPQRYTSILKYFCPGIISRIAVTDGNRCHPGSIKILNLRMMRNRFFPILRERKQSAYLMRDYQIQTEEAI